jgi:hypothetical protein
MFRWLQTLFSRKPYRTAEPWETPPEIRTKLRCASAGVDPETVQQPQEGAGAEAPVRPPLPTGPAGNR